jgi:hypothetical protein
MEYALIILYLISMFIFFNKYPQYKLKPNWLIILFFLLIFSETIFQKFTIWKGLALILFIGSLIYDLLKGKFFSHKSSKD